MNPADAKPRLDGCAGGPRPDAKRSKGDTSLESVRILINDTPRTLASTTTLAELVRKLGLAERKGVAIAVNNAVAPRATWPTHTLADGDRVLVIRATQGG
jgi:sulfur carrier protein